MIGCRRFRKIIPTYTICLSLGVHSAVGDQTWHDRRMLVAFSVAPTSAGESVAEAVADAIRIVRDSGLPHRVDSMFTTIEGEWDEVFDVIRRATEAVGQHGSRVQLVIKADIRPGYTGGLDAKDERLERVLNRADDQAVTDLPDAERRWTDERNLTLHPTLRTLDRDRCGCGIGDLRNSYAHGMGT